MIRIFKLVLLLVVSQVAFGQAPSNYTNINGRYRWIAGMFDSTFHIPKGTSPSLRTGGSTNAGGLFYNTSDSSVYTYTGTQWIKARGSINPSDTTNKYVTQVYKKNGSDSVFYVKGGNHLFAFVDSVGSPGGGGGGKIYYFNGGVNMGTIGGLQMYELGDTANTGAAANFTRSTTGNIANFITDPGKPGLVQIPAGVWSVDAWLSETGGGANHAEIWVEVEKWDGSTITTIATSPIEQITEGSTPNLYSWSVSIPTTSLTVTDRIIIQFYISNTNGKTVTLYTQNGYVGEVHTTFTTGIGAINGLTAPAQYLVTGTSGTDFNINSVTATHTFNLPTASATNRGALSSTDWTTFNSKLSPADTVSLSNRINLKLNISDTAAMLSPYARTNVVNAGLATKVNISDTASMLNPYARKNFLNAGTGISYSSTTGTIANTAPDQTVALNAGTGISISGTYPNFTITNSSPSSGGTVTSVGSNTGTGLTGGPITTSGTLAIDTLLISTRAWRQKGVDSVAALINSNVSGTTNRVSKFTASGAIGNSSIRDSSSSVALDISSQGNLGVGYVPNTWFSSVKTIQLPQGSLFAYSSPSKILGLGLNYYADAIGTERYMENGSASIYDQVNGAHRWSSAASGTAGNVISFTTRMLLQQSGELLLGAFTSDSMLNVQSGVHLGRGVRLSGLPTAPGTRAVRINANGTLSVSDTLTNGISGSGTTNYIPKFTSSSAIGNSAITDNGSTVTLNSRSMTIDAASNSFGELIYREGGSLKWNAYNDYNTDNYVLGNSGGSRLFLTQDGNLGLGVSPSAWALSGLSVLQVKNAGFLGYENNAYVTANEFVDILGNSKYIASAAATRYAQSAGTHAWFTAPSGTANATISFTQAMTLDASGRLGIGTTSPNNILQITAAAGSSHARWTESATTVGFVGGAQGIITGLNGSFAVRGENGLVLSGAGNAANLYINSSGNVGIGTTSPNYKLDVNGVIVGGDGTIRTTISYAAGGVVGTLTNHDLQLYTNGAEKVRITSGGNVGIGTSSPNATLDIGSSRTLAGTDPISVYNDTRVQSAVTGGLVGYNVRMVGLSPVSGSYTIANMYGIKTNTPVVQSNVTVTNSYGVYIGRTDDPSSGGVVTNKYALVTESTAGNVGIGTTSPNASYKLDITGDFSAIFNVTSTANSATYGGFVTTRQVNTVGNGNGIVFGMYNSSSATTEYAYIGTIIEGNTAGANNGAIVFNPTSAGLRTERMRITSGGDVGINTQTPNATFHVAGSIAAAIAIKTATYTLTSSDYTVVFDLNGNATANLPNATTCSGRIYVIKINRTNVSDVLTIDPSGAQTIDGNATYDLQCQQAITIQSDGSNWRIIGDYAAGVNCL